MITDADVFDKLKELLAQDQFELILPADAAKEMDALRLVYLMNDAVESFLVFRKVTMTGNYQAGYEGTLNASVQEDGDGYVLSVRQGESVVTLFFKKLELEVHLYEYSGIGHFWMTGHEDLRVLEYQIAILRDKYQYLGDSYCTKGERKLAALADFPPLNSCSYPAVPEQYQVQKDDPWKVTQDAVQVMEEFAASADDRVMLQMIRLYGMFPTPVIAKRIAHMLGRRKHAAVAGLIFESLQKENESYKRRTFGKAGDARLNLLLKKAHKKEQELKKKGIRAQVFREEPFTVAEDGIDFHVYLMTWKNGWRKSGVQVEEIL